MGRRAVSAELARHAEELLDEALAESFPASDPRALSVAAELLERAHAERPRRDADVDFLRWALPRLGLRWEGFRRVRRQVWRRIERRRREFGLADPEAYRAYLDAHPEEWAVVDHACRVTISRFGRDRRVWEALARVVLPKLAAGARAAGRSSVRAWCAGCGAGEEPYTLSIAGAVIGLAPPLEILGTDIDEVQVARAHAGCYPVGTLRELPATWREIAFDARGDLCCLREPRVRRARSMPLRGRLIRAHGFTAGEWAGAADPARVPPRRGAPLG